MAAPLVFPLPQFFSSLYLVHPPPLIQDVTPFSPSVTFELEMTFPWCPFYRNLLLPFFQLTAPSVDTA